MMLRRVRLWSWRGDALRTNLWLVPTAEVLLAAALFVASDAIDRDAYDGAIRLPSFVISGSADSARQILTAIAAAMITVVGVVFSITIVALTLASTQFGPRMLRNFIRDRVTQFTLGTFVATFFYAILVLISISPGPHGDFVPGLSITLALLLTALDLGVLILFINQIARTIQLPEVIASIARDLAGAIDASIPAVDPNPLRTGPSASEMLRRLEESSGLVLARGSGYLQFVPLDTVMAIATRTNSVIRLVHRPGHFVLDGHPLATVWPLDAGPRVAPALNRALLTGPHRTLAQDLSFAIDQLVEIAIRALSPAVNDTFTALTCIDWLADGLCKVCARWNPVTLHRDRSGRLRVITVAVSDTRLIERAFEKIRQAGRGMPAVMIRQLDALTSVMAHATTEDQRAAVRAQASMIVRSCEGSVSEERDRDDVHRAFRRIELAAARPEPLRGPTRG
jgi:uncharacterized membrane protein